MNINLFLALHIKVNSKLVHHLYIKLKAIQQILKEIIRKKSLRLGFKITHFKMDTEKTIHQKQWYLGLYQNLKSLLYRYSAEEVQTSQMLGENVFKSNI